MYNIVKTIKIFKRTLITAAGWKWITGGPAYDSTQECSDVVITRKECIV